MHPLLPLSISMHANKGVYALLLGSGVSSAAEIPTGWEITLDLIRKVAQLENAYCEPEPDVWYSLIHNEEPNYSALLAKLAKTPAERSQLLRGYFEPNAEERERGVKQPTAAHRAIAELVQNGAVRVIVTTNFDRLLEHALEEVGIVPTVIATPDAAQGALPLAHAACTIVKIHGDYLDARIRNTIEELERYPRAMNRLLDRIFDEYGLIICGWSAEWDSALRAALERCRSYRFATYWTVRHPKRPSALAQRLIDQRRAEIIPIADADAFFQQLTEQVTALDVVERPHPLAAKIAQATLQRYIVDDRYRVRLHQLVVDEAKRVYETLTGQLEGGYPLLYHGPPTPELLVERLAYYEALGETVRALLADGCSWGDERHHRLWVTALERLANLPTLAGDAALLNLRRYPALQALYAGGIAALAAERYDTLEALLVGGRVREYGREQPLVTAVNAYEVMTYVTGKLLSGKENHYVPFNDYLYANAELWTPLRELIPLDERFEECFDRFEYLLCMVCVDARMQQNENAWGPVGCFCHRASGYQQMSIPRMIGGELEQQGRTWPGLRAGLFGGSVERAQAAQQATDELAQRICPSFSN